ncbi:MAG: hypothetical protein EP343_25255 [Deltaproteobacteria bacterium]|nr:MAG: hypothetical protein EP343_25255 [Deltaproteobacteria bacterium]
MVHVRFEGKSFDFGMRDLNIQPDDSDEKVLERLAQHFEVGVARFEMYVVDRPKNGNLVIRPEAVYG